MNLKDSFDIEALNHPVTLKLFLYAKTIHPEDFGVREAKRKLDFNSPSTVLWHLDKLVEANLIEKLPTNRYKLLQSGLEIKEINVPVKYTAQIIRGELIPRRIFLISFVISAFLITLVFTFLNPLVASILGSVLLGINAVLYILNYLTIKRQLSYYSWGKEKEDSNE
jgi:DNA-binding transcriptional ArsR family regulator